MYHNQPQQSGLGPNMVTSDLLSNLTGGGSGMTMTASQVQGLPSGGPNLGASQASGQLQNDDNTATLQYGNQSVSIPINMANFQYVTINSNDAPPQQQSQPDQQQQLSMQTQLRHLQQQHQVGQMSVAAPQGIHITATTQASNIGMQPGHQHLGQVAAQQPQQQPMISMIGPPPGAGATFIHQTASGQYQTIHITDPAQLMALQRQGITIAQHTPQPQQQQLQIQNQNNQIRPPQVMMSASSQNQFKPITEPPVRQISASQALASHTNKSLAASKVKPIPKPAAQQLQNQSKPGSQSQQTKPAAQPQQQSKPISQQSKPAATKSSVPPPPPKIKKPTPLTEEELQKKYARKCDRIQAKIKEVILVNAALQSELMRHEAKLERAREDRNYLMERVKSYENNNNSSDQNGSKTSSKTASLKNLSVLQIDQIRGPAKEGYKS